MTIIYAVRHINPDFDILASNFEKLCTIYNLPVFENRIGIKFTIYQGSIIQSVNYSDFVK